MSSLMMDVAWGVAGLAVPLVGLAADRVGLQATLTGMALLPCWALCSLPPVGAHRRCGSGPVR